MSTDFQTTKSLFIVTCKLYLNGFSKADFIGNPKYSIKKPTKTTIKLIILIQLFEKWD